ncbi:hypothetical protein [uncultured Lamprocystis sp.]|jgi:hypothetical protein|uniref:hypothetical protein n=1 Tax=uncultured Lamprocystis sp. TaxID=543132 RepID=UPI0025FC3C64|nr:hypothetical protein [uncultured Lamprocystis sp.]
MQKGLGIAALVIAILAMFIPFAGTWLTLLVALLAVFAYGPGLGLGIASLVVNVVHILFLSPLLWATQGLASVGAEASGEQIVFLPWVLIGAQVAAFAVLLILNGRLVRPATATGTSLGQ